MPASTSQTRASSAVPSSGPPPGDDCPIHEVGELQQVLAALADPVRLEMVRRLGSLEATPCVQLYDAVSKSTASHHFKILREAGVTERLLRGNQTYQLLRLDAVEARHPGVLSAILAASSAHQPGAPVSR